MKERIKECFERLQGLTISTSLSNMEILVQTLYDLRDIYQSMEDDDGRDEADTE